MAYPLSGIRVVELRAGIAMAVAGMLLHDAGADVVMIEPPEGDVTRRLTGHRVWNRGKRSVVLPKSDPRVAQVLAGADVVLLGSRVSPNWKPQEQQIVCRAPAFADVEPYKRLPENESCAAALSGVMAGVGAYRSGPAFPVIPTVSYAVGAMVACGAMSALYVRQKTGIGQEVKVGWPSTGSYLAGYQASESDRIPRLPGAGGASPLGLRATWRVYRASDGWMGIACPNPVFFNRLCLALDRPDILTDPRFEGVNFLMPAAQEALVNALSEAISNRTQAELTAAFEQYGVPGAAVLTRDQFVKSDLVEENNMIVSVDDPEVGPVRQINIPFEISGVDLLVPSAAPRLGADTDAVLGGLSPTAAAVSRNNPLPQHPLAGIRVLDFTGFLAGPTAGRLLAELGAEVIKVEPPDGEGFRVGGLSCVGINVGKKSIAIDQGSHQGQEIRDRLIRSADVVLHALMPGAVERYGLDYGTVKSLNEKIIYSWITGFGKARKWQARPSFDMLLQSLSGQMVSSLGSPDQPIYSSVPMADVYCAMLTVYGIVISLYMREKTGEGREIRTNQVSSSMAAQSGEFVFYEGMPARGVNGNSLGYGAAYRLYEVQDGWSVLTVENAEAWRSLVALYPDHLKAWEDWSTAQSEGVESPLADALAGIFSGLTRHQIVEKLITADVPCAPIVTVRLDGISNEYYRDLKVLVDGIQHPIFGRLTTVDNFFEFSLTPARKPDIAQWIGEQNVEVLKSLGYADAEIEQLKQAKVISAPEFNLAR